MLLPFFTLLISKPEVNIVVDECCPFLNISVCRGKIFLKAYKNNACLNQTRRMGYLFKGHEENATAKKDIGHGYFCYANSEQTTHAHIPLHRSFSNACIMFYFLYCFCLIFSSVFQNVCL